MRSATGSTTRSTWATCAPARTLRRAGSIQSSTSARGGGAQQRGGDPSDGRLRPVDERCTGVLGVVLLLSLGREQWRKIEDARPPRSDPGTVRSRSPRQSPGVPSCAGGGSPAEGCLSSSASQLPSRAARCRCVPARRARPRKSRASLRRPARGPVRTAPPRSRPTPDRAKRSQEGRRGERNAMLHSPATKALPLRSSHLQDPARRPSRIAW